MVTVYRQPTNTIETYKRFSEKLRDIFNDLNSNNCTFYARSDYNIDVMKIQTHNNVIMHVNNMIKIYWSIVRTTTCFTVESFTKFVLFFNSPSSPTWNYHLEKHL